MSGYKYKIKIRERSLELVVFEEGEEVDSLDYDLNDDTEDLITEIECWEGGWYE